MPKMAWLYSVDVEKIEAADTALLAHAYGWQADGTLCHAFRHI